MNSSSHSATATLPTLLCLLALAAAPAAAQTHAVYTLTEYDGHAVPGTLPPSSSCENPATIRGGYLELFPDGVFQQGTTIVDCTGYRDGATEGTYRRSGGLIHFLVDGRVAFVGAPSGDILGVASATPPTRSLYRLGAEPQVEMSFEFERPEHAYFCERDESLAAHRFPAADTAGLNARIHRAFPGFRLSTRREIACRFGNLDGATPRDDWGEVWDSPRAFWVQRGDFDADGRTDIAVLLTPTTEGEPAQIGVLFADGTSAVIPYVTNSFSVIPAGERIYDARGRHVRFPGNTIAVSAGVDKTGSHFYWSDGEFRYSADPDAP
jgi:hypothetical protein